MSERVTVPAELVEALADDLGTIASGVETTLVAGVRFGKVRDIQRQLRALVSAAERPAAEQLCTCGHTKRRHAALRWECYDCVKPDQCSDFTPASPSLPDRDEAPSISDEAEELPEHEQNLRELWREVAEKGIEYGVDWPRIVLTLFGDIDRLAARLTAKEDDRG